MSAPTLRPLLLALFLFAAAPLQAQAPRPEMATVLAMPLSPGSIALLVEYGQDAAVLQRLRDALRDPRAEVRSVAARVIFAGGLRMLVPELRVALKAEQDAGAGAEEIRGLLTFTPPLAAECVTAAVRLGEPAAGVAVETFARLNSPQLLVHLTALEDANAPPMKILEALQAISDGNPDIRDRLLRDFAADRLCVEFLLADFRKSGDRSHDAAIVSLLKSDNEDVRTLAVWHVARLATGETAASTIAPELQAALDSLFAASETRVSWEALGLELIARATHRSRHERDWPA